MTERETAPAISAKILAALGRDSISEIYRHQIRPLRTRRYVLDAPKPGTAIEIQHTLLGIELKMGHRRVFCPDLATARYFEVFARFGCQVIAVPYDITQIAMLAHQLESSWHRMWALAESFSARATTLSKSRVRSILINGIREEIDTAGAGPERPVFVQETRQRKRK